MHPFIERIIILLKAEHMGKDQVNFITFVKLMSVFCFETPPEAKRKLLFRIYDKENKQIIPLIRIRTILSDELSLRTHYSEVQPGA